MSRVGHVVCSIENLGSVVGELLDEFSLEAVQIQQQAVQEVTKEAAKIAKQSGPYQDHRGKYRKSLTSKTQNSGLSTEGVVYSKGQPGLGHLLEHGHRLWNAVTVTGEFVHWKEAEEYASQRLVERLIELLGG